MHYDWIVPCEGGGTAAGLESDPFYDLSVICFWYPT